MGGPGGEVSVDSALVALLRKDAASYKWAAAMTSASTAAPVQLATRTPILAIGGFNGTDQSLTLARFQELVADKQIHYYIAGGGFAGSPNQGVAGEIAAWVQKTFPSVSVGSATVYDLTAPASSSEG
jgi:hypothetical protein